MYIQSVVSCVLIPNDTLSPAFASSVQGDGACGEECSAVVHLVLWHVAALYSCDGDFAGESVDIARLSGHAVDYAAARAAVVFFLEAVDVEVYVCAGTILVMRLTGEGWEGGGIHCVSGNALTMLVVISGCTQGTY